MPATQSATVETLTAEVRVLMVGSRQITLSVARQLDWVELEDMEPFGRVRLDADPTVIGRDRETGALVLATYRLPHEPVFLDSDDLEQSITVCATHRLANDRAPLAITFEGTRVQVSALMVTLCGVAGHFWHQTPSGVPACLPPILLHGQERSVRRAVAAEAERIRLRRSMDDLPLIVLAGLR
jgi:hypothetical protein